MQNQQDMSIYQTSQQNDHSNQQIIYGQGNRQQHGMQPIISQQQQQEHNDESEPEFRVIC